MRGRAIRRNHRRSNKPSAGRAATPSGPRRSATWSRQWAEPASDRITGASWRNSSSRLIPWSKRRLDQGHIFGFKTRRLAGNGFVADDGPTNPTRDLFETPAQGGEVQSRLARADGVDPVNLTPAEQMPNQVLAAGWVPSPVVRENQQRRRMWCGVKQGDIISQ